MSDELYDTGPHPSSSRRGLAGRIFEAFGKRMVRLQIHGQITLTLPDGHEVVLGGATRDGFAADLKINSYQVLAKAIRRGSVGFGEAYIAGDIDSSDLVALFRFFLDNRKALHQAGGKLFRARLGDKLAHWRRRNTLKGSRKNIEAHYDLGNDFYELWLDPTMTYSSGLFSKPGMTLAEAQHAKYDRTLELMQLKPNARILEIGCGWGGMAEHAGRAGHLLDGITLSKEQLSYAHRRIHRQGLEKRVSLSLKDYRQTTGQYDAIVSIEMIEAVGEGNWPAYFARISGLLKPGGRAVIQAITIAPEYFDRYRSKADFIQRYIFPGGMLLTDQAIARQAASYGMSVVHTQKFGADYARTLNEWRERFNASSGQVSKLGYHQKFKRMWLYYLTYCEAGFADGAINVGFYVIEKPAD